MNKSTRNGLIAFAVALIVILGGFAYQQFRAGDAAVSPLSIGGPFTLVDQNGVTRHDTDFHGRLMLIYFGYTFCPDVCPTTLTMMSDALAKLGPAGAPIVPIFITVDPARDTPKALKTYLAAFGPSFVGLTGAPADIATVAHEYRVYYGKRALKGGGYAMDHSGEVYLLGPDGTLLGFYDPPIDGKALAEDLAKHL